MQIRLSFRIWIVLELKVLPLERDGVVEEELRSIFEGIREGILGEVPGKGARDIREHEGNTVSQVLGKDGGQSSECIVGASGDARDGAIGEDNDRCDGVDVLLDLSGNTLLVELVLLDSAGVGQPRCV